jgi:hypothetical protein
MNCSEVAAAVNIQNLVFKKFHVLNDFIYHLQVLYGQQMRLKSL